MASFATHYGKDQRVFSSARGDSPSKLNIDRPLNPGTIGEVIFRIDPGDSSSGVRSARVVLNAEDTLKALIVSLRLMGVQDLSPSSMAPSTPLSANLTAALTHLRAAVDRMNIDPRVDAVAESLFDDEEFGDWAEANNKEFYRSRAAKLLKLADDVVASKEALK